MRAAVEEGRLVELPGDRVEGSLDEPDLAERPAHEGQRVAGEGVEPDGRDDPADIADHVVDGDHGEDRREHHDEEEGEEAAAAAPEAEAGEGVGGQHREEDLEGGHDGAHDDRVGVPAQEGALLIAEQARVVGQADLGGDELGRGDRAQGIE